MVILTGNELFSSTEPRQTWEMLGGKYARYGAYAYHEDENDWLAEATQFLYLGFDSKDLINRHRHRRLKHKSINLDKRKAAQNEANRPPCLKQVSE
jgi:nuclear transport factor 2 (NTF2) superfamily protein